MEKENKNIENWLPILEECGIKNPETLIPYCENHMQSLLYGGVFGGRLDPISSLPISLMIWKKLQESGIFENGNVEIEIPNSPGTIPNYASDFGLYDEIDLDDFYRIPKDFPSPKDYLENEISHEIVLCVVNRILELLKTESEKGKVTFIPWILYQGISTLAEGTLKPKTMIHSRFQIKNNYEDEN